MASPTPGSFIRSSLLAELRSTFGAAFFAACALCVVLFVVPLFMVPCMEPCVESAGAVPCAWPSGAMARQRAKSVAAQHANWRFMNLLLRGMEFCAPVRPRRCRRDRVSEDASWCSLETVLPGGRGRDGALDRNRIRGAARGRGGMETRHWMEGPAQARSSRTALARSGRWR